MAIDPNAPCQHFFPASLRSKLLREGWSIHKRLKSFKSASSDLLPSHKSLISFWLQALAKGNEEAFKRRLSWDGLTPENIAWALDPPDESIPNNPQWINLLEEISKIGMVAHKSRRLMEDITNSINPHLRTLPFCDVWLPVATWIIDRLRNDYCQGGYQLRLTETAWHDLEISILSRLCNVTDQVLWHIFNSNRSSGIYVAAEVRIRSGKGNSNVKAFYNRFVDSILASGYQSIFHEYPVLGRIVSQTLESWRISTQELLHRINDSLTEIEDVFRISPKAFLSKVECDLGDIHQGGRSVSILWFQDSELTTTRVVYKPKNLALDANFNTFIDLLNKTCSLASLRSAKVLSKGDYGFMEWIEHKPCSSRDELLDFYENSGRILAILHLLGCTDCHHENLIANGDQLVLIDCETLFHPELRVLIENSSDDDSPLNVSMNRSVLRTGLLPQWSITGNKSRIAYDISALGISVPPEKMEVPGWLNINTDAMIPGAVLEATNLPTSLPITRQCSLSLLDFADSIVNGFQKQSQTFIDDKLYVNNALSVFSGGSRRLIMRATRVYHSIQRQLLEPSALISSDGQFIRLEKLARCFLPSKNFPLNWPVFHEEVAQMEDLDIPFFDHLLDSVEVRLKGTSHINNHLIERTGLESCQARLHSFNSDEVNFQAQLIYGSIKAKFFNTRNRSLGQCLFSAHEACKPMSRSQYIAETLRIAREIWSASIMTPNGAPEWLSLDLSSVSDCYNFGIIGDSLYSGTSGIGILFARLSHFYSGTDEAESQKWMDRANKCFSHLQRFFQADTKAGYLDLLRNTSLGLSGSAGHLIVLSIMQMLGSSMAIQAKTNIIENLQVYLRSTSIHVFDILGGLGGLIGPLLLDDLDCAIELAIICGDIIVEQQDASGGWRTSNKTLTRTRPPLTGFSHGTSGIAAALLKLHQLTHQNRFADAAFRALSYERSTFDMEAANWPDLRVGEAENRFGRSWCHGAPGILLSRLIIRRLGFDDSLIDREIDTAKLIMTNIVQQMQASDWSVNSNVCCGFFGLSSILRLEAKLSLSAPPPLLESAESGLVSFARKQNGYPFGDSLFRIIDMPGLLTGNAGIALALLESVEGGDWLTSVISSALLEPQL